MEVLTNCEETHCISRWKKLESGVSRGWIRIYAVRLIEEVGW
jgi:hypothetical protein